jgi:hypothetical protein
VIRLQLPAGAVIGDFETVRDPQMPAERLRTKTALEANHIILLDRASDWHCGPGRLLHGRGTPETGKRPMHLVNQSCELVGPDLVMPHIAADDLRDLIRIDSRRRVLPSCSPCIYLGRFLGIGLKVSDHPPVDVF